MCETPRRACRIRCLSRGREGAPLLGVLADRSGSRPILLPSLLVCAPAGAACALARDLQTLLALRFVQGTGAAVIGSLIGALIGDLVAVSDRAGGLR